MDQMITIRSLNRAAVEGDTASLHNLLGASPHLLDGYTEAGPYIETPLHIAALFGHTEFLEVIVGLKPELTSKLDPQRSSPLHLAAAEGHLNIVKKLLVADPEMCFIHDCTGRNPLHVAATRGHVDVLKELVRGRPVAARDRAGNGETILHLCVKHKKWESLKILMEITNDHEFVNSKDYDGNTILHLAAANGQKEMMQFLIRNTEVEVHSPNLNGFTAFNILARIESPEDRLPVENNVYLHAAGIGQPGDSHALSSESDHHAGKPREDGDWLEQKKSALMVVASLIATMAFQASICPPGGVWEQDGYYNIGSKKIRYYTGTSKLACTRPDLYKSFIIFNTTSFVASVSIILLLISGISLLMRRAFMWVLTVIMWIAISAVSMTYTVSLKVLTSPSFETIFYILVFAVQIWSFLMLLLLPGHLIRLVVKFIRRKIKVMRINNHIAGV